MLNLSANNVHLNGTAMDKQQAIGLVAQGLINNGNVAQGYEQAMLERETQTSTFLGNGIAIPHGTLASRDLVQQTGVQIYQFPQGVAWGEGNIAYVVIGIAAKSDEHLSLLRQLTAVLSDESAAETLAKTGSLDEFIQVLKGEKALPMLSEALISLNLTTESLLTLSALNAAELQEQGYVNQQFVQEVLAGGVLALADNLFINDSRQGNLQNGVAIARNQQGKTLITVAVKDEQIQPMLARLLNPQVRQQFSEADAAQLIRLLAGENVEGEMTAQADNASGQIEGIFTIFNEHGLHARPSAVLVNEVKKYNAQIEVQNLDRNTPLVSAKSLMKIVALGTTKGHQLRFVASGEEAQQAINGIGKAIAEGLGEGASATMAEVAAATSVTAHQQEPSENSTVQPTAQGVEGIFTIHNEHGLHARPSAVLVNEVKKYNAQVEVQNLDRNTPLVPAKSLMKIVALGTTKGQKLRFVASGAEAQQAIDGIGKAIAEGLGE